MVDNSEEEAVYGLIVSFPDQSASFVHGYEAGKLGYRMEFTAEQSIEDMVHTENEEVIRRMCNAFGWSCEFTQITPPMKEWRNVRLERLPQRKHLSVVK